ncbi:MAG: hypothetical protein WC528_01035 [Patescibacteria group bacterium]
MRLEEEGDNQEELQEEDDIRREQEENGIRREMESQQLQERRNEEQARPNVGQEESNGQEGGNSRAGDEKSDARSFSETIRQAKQAADKVKKVAETAKKVHRFVRVMQIIWGAITFVIGTWWFWLIVIALLFLAIIIGFCKQDPCQCTGAGNIFPTFGQFIYDLLNLYCKTTG